MLPAIFVIGDDLAFRLDDVKSGRDGSNLPDATVSYVMMDAETREEITAGDMDQYDTDPSSFDGVIAANFLTEEAGIVNGKDYLLRTTIHNGGVRTTKTATLKAVYDEPENT